MAEPMIKISGTPMIRKGIPGCGAAPEQCPSEEALQSCGTTGPRNNKERTDSRRVHG